MKIMRKKVVTKQSKQYSKKKKLRNEIVIKKI